MNSGDASPPSAATGKTREHGGSGLTSSPLPFPAGGEGHRHRQQAKHKQLFLIFFPFSRICFFLLLLQICFFRVFVGLLFFPSPFGGRSAVEKSTLRRGRRCCCGKSGEWLPGDSHGMKPAGLDGSSTLLSSLVGDEANRGLRRGERPH